MDISSTSAAPARQTNCQEDTNARDDQLELTIIMPCLNEAETIQACVSKAHAFLTRARVTGEVLIADNGSTDGSQTVARELGARVVDVQTKGYGAALLGGIKAARGRYIVMGDADDSYDFSRLDEFIARLRNGADLVIGNRFKGGIAAGAMPMLHRYLGNPVLSFLGRLFFTNISIGDFHCGLRAFRADAIRGLGLQTSGMEFASEMVVRSALAGLKITEVPTALRPDGRSRRPHLKTWRDGWRHLKFLLMYSPRWLFMVPGAIFLTIGLFFGAILYVGPLNITDLIFDLNAFVTACFMVVVGTQLLTFGGLSRYYATVTGFLPNSRRARALVEHATTDRLVWLAVALLVIGLLIFASAVASWAETGFGPITSPLVPRTVVMGLTTIVIGLQTLFSAFLFGILSIPITRA